MTYGRFSERAQLVIINAQKESAFFKHGYIGTEHILLGIIAEGGKSAELLNENNVNLENVRNLVGKFLGYGECENMPKDELLLTPRTKRLFDDSISETKRLNHKSVTPEHFLMILLNQGEGVAHTILVQLGVDFIKLRSEVARVIASMEENVAYMDNNSSKKSNKTPILDQYGTDLTKKAIEGNLDPVIGRDKETKRVLEILCRRIKNNPCLIGEPGVGKTSVVEGLAQRIVEGNVPQNLIGKKLICLDISSMVAGAKYRGEFEDRLKKAIKEIKDNKEIIIFIDEIHSIVGAGGAEGAIDASSILKPVLARGEIQCIGATTIDEYRKHIAKDSALERRFQPILLEEPNKEDTLKILEGIRDKYEKHHKVKITDEALSYCVELADRYITDRFMPDKAIDIMDEAAAKLRMENISVPPDLKKKEEEIYIVEKEKEEAIKIQDFEKAALLRDNESSLKKELEDLKLGWDEKSGNNLIVNKDIIAKVVSSWTNIPVEKLNQEEKEKLLNLEELLKKRVIGQDEAIKLLAQAIRRGRVGLRDPNRPIGSFIFAGPTGVGKTQLSKALAEVLFSDEDNIIRIDMSEYMEKHSVSRLIGSPPGYVGFEEGGQLTEAVRRKPYSIILLDEIEKAHPDVFNILLQVMDDGRLTDSKGKVVNFKNTVIIMTSNVGADLTKKTTSLGFSKDDNKNSDYERMKENINEEMKKTFKPEFLNRVDEIIVFNKLNDKNMISIVDLMIKDINERLENSNIKLSFNEESKEFLINKEEYSYYGARPLRRTITREVENILSEELLKGEVEPGDNLRVVVDDSKLKFIKQ